jgi:hypothetical protein
MLFTDMPSLKIDLALRLASKPRIHNVLDLRFRHPQSTCYPLHTDLLRCRLWYCISYRSSGYLTKTIFLVIIRNQLIHVYAKPYEGQGRNILIRFTRYSMDGLILAEVGTPLEVSVVVVVDCLCPGCALCFPFTEQEDSTCRSHGCFDGSDHRDKALVRIGAQVRSRSLTGSQLDKVIQ